MKTIKMVLAIVVAILTLVGAVSVINQLLNYDGSAFSSGEIGGSIAIVCFAAVGSIMLFKSALKKPEPTEEKKEK